MTYPLSDFNTKHVIDTPGKRNYFQFMFDQSGGDGKVLDRIDRGCGHLIVTNQFKYFLKIVDYDELKDRVLEIYDLPKNHNKRHWPLEDKINAYVKNRCNCLASQWRGKTVQIYNMLNDKSYPITSSFISDDTPKLKKQDSYNQVQEILELVRKLDKKQRSVLDTSLTLIS